MSNDDYTHADLVQRAIRWLFGTQRCTAVVSEANPGLSGEVVDALGWRPDTTSVLVECKISRQDYNRDGDKPWRTYSALGVGRYRWYLVPQSLAGDIRSAVASRPGWGLIVAYPSTIKVVITAEPFLEINRSREIKLLMDATRQRNPIEAAREASLADGLHEMNVAGLV